jgi:hypothetical protein
MSTMQPWLFPISQTYISGFTTSPYVNMAQIKHVALSDSALGVTRVASGTDHPVVIGPDTKSKAWKATYAEGSYSPDPGRPQGGFSFYLAGSKPFASQLPTAKAVMTSYSVRFEKEFEWQLGGKLLHVLVLIAQAKYYYLRAQVNCPDNVSMSDRHSVSRH